ncbi:MAG TPA: aminotransferase class I/II-fold pyridoxal phosphate-dependent enzyme [Candidatus Angelobacter sp.]|nr:aminotransferase class I/II-fold pyridoxal phosphate-dependent enzyme [Candidatus Angelobacter sp.]
MADSPFETLSLDELRTRTSIKWRMYPPDVLPLWVAEMDAMPAPAVTEALEDALRRGDVGYPPLDTSYAEALAGVARRRWGWELDLAATQTVADVLTGVHHTIAVLSEPGDVVLVPSPVYPPLLDFTADMGRRVVPVPLTVDGRLDIEAIDAAMPSARVLLLCSPHNPTGTVHTAEELRAVAALAEQHGVDVVVDEIHALLVPKGTGFTPYLSVTDRGVVVTSASKAFNLAGLKAGVIVGGPASRDVVERLPRSLGYGVSHLGAMAHMAAWREGDAWLDAVNAAVAANAVLLGELLAERMPGIGYRPPQATYLAWLDCSDLGLGDDPAAVFLERGRVGLNAGAAFGVGGAGHVRLNLAASRATLTEAVDRMARAVG